MLSKLTRCLSLSWSKASCLGTGIYICSPLVLVDVNPCFSLASQLLLWWYASYVFQLSCCYPPCTLLFFFLHQTQFIVQYLLSLQSSTNIYFPYLLPLRLAHSPWYTCVSFCFYSTSFSVLLPLITGFCFRIFLYSSTSSCILVVILLSLIIIAFPSAFCFSFVFLVGLVSSLLRLLFQ
jgi:hypothetical protein